MEAALRAFIGYFFMVLIVRIVGRRPGKQLTPFEFVLIFFIGGLALTAIVGDELSFTNAICQVIALGLAHHVTSWIRGKSSRAARDKGLRKLSDVDRAILERNGDISVLPK
jgi:uncharacterized membrane protein YcaP (DUF421 family)